MDYWVQGTSGTENLEDFGNRITGKMRLTPSAYSVYNPPKIHLGGISMKGTVGFDKKSERYYVAWYHEPIKKMSSCGFIMEIETFPFQMGNRVKSLPTGCLTRCAATMKTGSFGLRSTL